jgi:hypothetical protein
MSDATDTMSDTDPVEDWNEWGATKNGEPVEWGEWSPTVTLRLWGAPAVLQQRWQRMSKNLMLKKYPNLTAWQWEWRKVPHVGPAILPGE